MADRVRAAADGTDLDCGTFLQRAQGDLGCVTGDVLTRAPAGCIYERVRPDGTSVTAQPWRLGRGQDAAAPLRSIEAPEIAVNAACVSPAHPRWPGVWLLELDVVLATTDTTRAMTRSVPMRARRLHCVATWPRLPWQIRGPTTGALRSVVGASIWLWNARLWQCWRMETPPSIRALV